MYFHKLFIGLILGFIGGVACKTAIDHRRCRKINPDVIDADVK